MIRHLGALIIFLSLTGALQATPATQAEIDNLVTKLGDPDFRVRKSASETLTQLVDEQEQVYQMLVKHAGHDDPEVRVRIHEALQNKGTVLKWLNPSKEGAVRSQHTSRIGSSLEFKNRSPHSINIYWLDFSGKRQTRSQSLAQGETYFCRRTYESHVWLITDQQGKGLGMYVMGAKDAKVIFRGPVSE